MRDLTPANPAVLDICNVYSHAGYLQIVWQTRRGQFVETFRYGKFIGRRSLTEMLR